MNDGGVPSELIVAPERGLNSVYSLAIFKWLTNKLLCIAAQRLENLANYHAVISINGIAMETLIHVKSIVHDDD